ncbi:hypothetical protein J3L16_11385 [Alteromonas sp. 5E99-2]|uniref:BPSS1780 family membrane protein n=1 Tax=Alteromonas sp. 5E99-2 TaxID=2817683 RepID=UPI001A97E3AE|nr:BPSS1780 family membrane protein [Alteromonas sp. 5E99-2]MBO1256284.1 hypothetical protein [Alteromonas sp. 5E99-2]
MSEDKNQIQTDEKIQANTRQDNAEYVGPQAKKITAANQWVMIGFRIFKRDAGAWVITALLWLVISIGLQLVPLLGFIAATLLFYVWQGGIMKGCQAVYEGKPFDVHYLFAAFKDNLKPLIQLSLLYAVISSLVMFAFLGDTYTEIVNGDEALSNPNLVVTQLLLGMCFALLLLTPLFMAVWFAPALIVFHNMPVLTAMKESFVGCFKNTLPFLLFGFWLVALYLIVMLSFGLAVFVAIPITFASSYAAYREIFLAEVDE